jgi:hypothetical protein
VWLTIAKYQFRGISRTLVQAQYSLTSMDDGSPLGSRSLWRAGAGVWPYLANLGAKAVEEDVNGNTLD